MEKLNREIKMNIDRQLMNLKKKLNKRINELVKIAQANLKIDVISANCDIEAKCRLLEVEIEEYIRNLEGYNK